MKNLIFILTGVLFFAGSTFADVLTPKLSRGKVFKMRSGCTFQDNGHYWYVIAKDMDGKEHRVNWKKKAERDLRGAPYHLLPYNEAVNLCKDDETLPLGEEYEALWSCFEPQGGPRSPLSTKGLQELNAKFSDMIVKEETISGARIKTGGGFYSSTQPRPGTLYASKNPAQNALNYSGSVVAFYGDDGHIGSACRNCTSFPGSARCVNRE